jgi:hypothetical protein
VATETERVEGQNAVTFKLDVFVIPKDEFFGLVADMAEAIVKAAGAYESLKVAEIKR